MLDAILRNRRQTLVEPPAARTGSLNPADAAQESEGEIVTVATLERRRHMLAQVDEALCRLAAGRYGLCADCTEPIPPARLRALPFAVRCCPCQERVERRTGGGAAPPAGTARRAAPSMPSVSEPPVPRDPAAGTNGRQALRTARANFFISRPRAGGRRRAHV